MCSGHMGPLPGFPGSPGFITAVDGGERRPRSTARTCPDPPPPPHPPHTTTHHPASWSAPTSEISATSACKATCGCGGVERHRTNRRATQQRLAPRTTIDGGRARQGRSGKLNGPDVCTRTHRRDGGICALHCCEGVEARRATAGGAPTVRRRRANAASRRLAVLARQVAADHENWPSRPGRPCWRALSA